jgi:hypothetical protein
MAGRKASGVAEGVGVAVVAGLRDAVWMRGVGDVVAIEEVEAQAGNVISASAASHGPLIAYSTGDCGSRYPWLVHPDV